METMREDMELGIRQAIRLPFIQSSRHAGRRAKRTSLLGSLLGSGWLALQNARRHKPNIARRREKK